MFKRRPDATLVTDAPAYRRIMPHIMRTRNECVVYFDLEIDISKTRVFMGDWIAKHPDEPKITIFHVVLWAVVQTIHKRPRLNRFTAGRRLWQRDGIWVSYSAKKRLDDKSPIVIIKRRCEPTDSFDDLVHKNRLVLDEGRSNKKSHVDKELDIMLRLPNVALRALVAAGRAADSAGLLPKAFIDNDPMFASIFIANLGSLKMDAAYHHLYEYGNIPIFCVIGRTKEVPAIVDGKLEQKPTVTLRFSYDERVEDGLYAQRSMSMLREMVEDPSAYLQSI